MSHLDLPIRAATEVLTSHGIQPDRCDVLQDGSTLVLRLTETLVARIVQDTDGPRQGSTWFTRENALAQHLTQHQAPIIPLHPDLPPGPHQHSGYPMNFWVFVDTVVGEPSAADIGRTLFQCHQTLCSFTEPLPELAIVTESLDILRTRNLFPTDTKTLLIHHLERSIDILRDFPAQPLHGDAHMGNLMNTTTGLLWTDWEDTFTGPVEWDLASIIWNAKILENDHATADNILTAYIDAGGQINPIALEQCLIARAAVMSAWYPILYPNPNAERRTKLLQRLDWLKLNR